MDIISLEEGYAILEDTINNWVEAGLRNLPNALIAAVIVVAFWIISILLSRTFEKVFHRVFDSEVILRLLSTILKVLIVTLGVYISLGTLGLQKAAISMLAGAGVVGIALGFAFQDTAENLIAGIVMGIRKPFRTGDLIETHDRMGFVRKLNLRNTILENFDGQLVIIPNKEVFQNTLVNYQVSGKRRVEFDVGVAYNTDLSEAIECAENVLEKELKFIVDGKATVLAYAFGDSSITLKVRYWVEVPGEVGYLTAKHLGVKAVHREFGASGINIPFPIRTLELGASAEKLFVQRNGQKSHENEA